MSDSSIAVIYWVGTIFIVGFLVYMRINWGSWFTKDPVVAWFGFLTLAMGGFYGLIGAICMTLSATGKLPV